MKIYVIDNLEQIAPDLLTSESDVSFFTDEIQAVNAIEHHAPNLIFLNYSVRGKDTSRYIDLILSLNPSINVVLIGDNLADDQVLASLLVGAKGYQNLKELPSYISKMVKVIGANEAWISRVMTAKLIDTIRQQHILENAQDAYVAGGYIETTSHKLL